MKELTSIDNLIIFLACNGLRSCKSNLMAISAFKGLDDGNLMKNLEEFGPWSELAKLIGQWKWEELFTNRLWLDTLKNADDLNFLKHGELTAHLNALERYFPEKDIFFKKIKPATKLIQ